MQKKKTVFSRRNSFFTSSTVLQDVQLFSSFNPQPIIDIVIVKCNCQVSNVFWVRQVSPWHFAPPIYHLLINITLQFYASVKVGLPSSQTPTTMHCYSDHPFWGQCWAFEHQLPVNLADRRMKTYFPRLSMYPRWLSGRMRTSSIT